MSAAAIFSFATGIMVGGALALATLAPIYDARLADLERAVRVIAEVQRNILEVQNEKRNWTIPR